MELTILSNALLNQALQQYIDNWETNKVNDTKVIKQQIDVAYSNKDYESLVQLSNDLNRLLNASKPTIKDLIRSKCRVVCIFDENIYSMNKPSNNKPANQSVGSTDKNHYPHPFEIGDTIYLKAKGGDATSQDFQVTAEGLLDTESGVIVRPSNAVLDFKVKFEGFTPLPDFKGFAGITYNQWHKK